MRVNSLSYSAISTFETCPYKFLKIYGEEKAEDRVDRAYAEATIEGCIVHDVLEQWHHDRKKPWQDILTKVIEETKERYNENKLAYEILQSRQFTGAYALLADYMRRNDIEVAIVDTEKSFDVVLPNGVPIIGRIDRVDMTETGIRLVDYKTTRSFIWKDEVENSLQGQMYVLAAMYFLYPNEKSYEFMIDALRFNPLTVTFTQDQLKAAEQYLAILYDRIEKMKPKEAEPRVNRYCGYCQIQDTCPAWDQIRTGKIPAVDIAGRNANATMEDIAKEVLELDNMIDATKRMQYARKDDLDKRMQDMGLLEHLVGDILIAYDTTPRGNPKLTVKKEKKNGK